MVKLYFLFISILFSCIVLAANKPIPESEDLMALICDSKSQIIEISNGKKKSWACSSCPSFTGFKGGKVNFELEAVYSGNFSSGGKQEIVMSFRGCESHADGFGGVAVISKVLNQWSRTKYEGSESLANCASYQAKTNLTELFCLEGDMHAGTYSSWFAQVSFGVDQSKSEKTLLKGIEFGGNAAGGTLINNFCYDLSPENWIIANQNPLTIKIIGRGGMLRQKSAAESDCDTQPKKDFLFQIDLSYNGSEFIPTSSSAKSIGEIQEFRKRLLGSKKK